MNQTRNERLARRLLHDASTIVEQHGLVTGNYFGFNNHAYTLEQAHADSGIPCCMLGALALAAWRAGIDARLPTGELPNVTENATWPEPIHIACRLLALQLPRRNLDKEEGPNRFIAAVARFSDRRATAQKAVRRFRHAAQARR
jgi:hypothetical protein